MWAQLTMHWDIIATLDDPVLAADFGGTDLGRRRGLLMLQMFVIHLANGETITCKEIQPATIREYIRAVRDFLHLFTAWDFGKLDQSNKNLAPGLQHIFAELDRYHTKPPNRREPFTPAMLNEAKRRADAVRDTNPHGIEAALADWFTCGLFAGLRKSEWCQDRTHKDPRTPAIDERTNLPKAFMLADIRIETSYHARATGASILNFPLADIAKLWIHFKTQKNGNHGEERLFVKKDDETAPHCFVQSMYRIIQRHVALNCDPAITPLSVFRDRAGKVRNITSDVVERNMQSIAVKVCRFNPKKEEDQTMLTRWTCHSLRVGACTTLHSMGYSTLDIQWLLRWKSLAFFAYLRNLRVLADNQAKTLNKAAAMPHLF